MVRRTRKYLLCVSCTVLFLYGIVAYAENPTVPKIEQKTVIYSFGLGGTPDDMRTESPTYEVRDVYYFVANENDIVKDLSVGVEFPMTEHMWIQSTSDQLTGCTRLESAQQIDYNQELNGYYRVGVDIPVGVYIVLEGSYLTNAVYPEYKDNTITSPNDLTQAVTDNSLIELTDGMLIYGSNLKLRKE